MIQVNILVYVVKSQSLKLDLFILLSPPASQNFSTCEEGLAQMPLSFKHNIVKGAHQYYAFKIVVFYPILKCTHSYALLECSPWAFSESRAFSRVLFPRELDVATLPTAPSNNVR